MQKKYKIVKKEIIFILLFVVPIIVSAQLEIELTTTPEPIYVEDGDTLSVCIDSMVIIEAIASFEGIPVEDATFKWDFDDGHTIEDVNLDSVSHTYEEGGGYRVKLTVISGKSETGFIIQPIKIANKPDYSETVTDIPDEQDGICKGSRVNLTGKAVPKLWEDEPIYMITEEPPEELSNTKFYESTLTFDEFPIGTVFNSGDIDSVGVKFEHSDMGNVQIKLVCPNGSSVILKDYDNSNHSYIGEPIDDETSIEYGTGYDYYWSEESGSETINTITLATIPAAVYLPEEQLSNFNGCPLNGSWKIEITDGAEEDNGFIFSWNLIFDEDILPDIWNFKDTLVKYFQYEDESIAGTYWLGKNIGGTSLQIVEDTIIGNASATPKVYGNNGYTYHVVNNWGCQDDTTIVIRVEAVTFTANPETAEANTDSIKFESTTSWGQYFDWEFGDDSDNASSETINHLYLEKGTYTVILKVLDENECLDTDTLEIEITVELSELDEVPNIFTPNKDGKNDFLKFNAKGMKSFSFVIYSRWGHKVYETSSQDEIKEDGWDGKMPITKFMASPGMYFYIIKGEGKDDKKYDAKGVIHLMR